MTTVSTDLTPAGGGTLLFMHIPKTAGTSLRREVGRAYAPTERAYIYDGSGLDGVHSQEGFAQLPLERRRELRLVFGHFRFGLHRAVPGPSAYAAVVRDPVDRVISVYSHYRFHKGVRYRLMSPAARAQDPAAMERYEIESRGIGLEEWVLERGRREVDNQMVRQLTGAPGIPFGACDDRLLERALENLDGRFALLLVQEELERSMAALADRIGRPLRSARRLKVNRRREATARVDPGVRQRIAELNRLDVELYRVARERLVGAATAAVG